MARPVIRHGTVLLSGLTVRGFSPPDQDSAQRLILAGLQERFGELDESMNGDLESIHASYPARGHVFLVADMDGRLVGTGALLVGKVDGQVVRVSVAPGHRRKGLARAIVEALVAEASVRRLDSVWVETNDDWEDAIALYQSIGFLPYDHREGCIFMWMDLNAQP